MLILAAGCPAFATFKRRPAGRRGRLREGLLFFVQTRPAGRPWRLRLCHPKRDALVRLACAQGASPSLPPVAAMACLPGLVVVLGTGVRWFVRKERVPTPMLMATAAPPPQKKIRSPSASFITFFGCFSALKRFWYSAFTNPLKSQKYYYISIHYDFIVAIKRYIKYNKLVAYYAGK